MKLSLTFLVLFASSVCFSQNSKQDLAINTQSKKCYVRCNPENKISKYIGVDCNLVKKNNELVLDFSTNHESFSRADKKRIKNTIAELTEKGFVVEILSHYDSDQSDAYNIKKSRLRAEKLRSFLKSLKINLDYVWIRSFGNRIPKIKCKKNDEDCTKHYDLNTRFEYKITAI